MSEALSLSAAPCRPAWAHEHGIMSLGLVHDVPTALAELADRLMVQETAYRYALAYDERRLDVLQDVFTADLQYSASVSGELAGEMEGRDGVMAYLEDVMRNQDDQRRHVCSNPVIESLTADRADLTMYMSIFASDTASRLVTTGFYRMGMRKEGAAWRIDSLCIALDRPF